MTDDTKTTYLKIAEDEVIVGDPPPAVAALADQLAQQAEEAENQAQSILQNPDATLKEVSDAAASLLGPERQAALTGSTDESGSTSGLLGELIEKGNQLVIADATKVLADPNATVADLSAASATLLGAERQNQLLGADQGVQSPMMELVTQLADKARETLIAGATKVLGDPDSTVKEVSDAIGSLLGAERQSQLMGSASGGDKLSPYMELVGQLTAKAETQWPGITTLPDSGSTSTVPTGTASGGTAGGGDATSGTSGSTDTAGGWEASLGDDETGSSATGGTEAQGETTPSGGAEPSGGGDGLSVSLEKTENDDGSMTMVQTTKDADGEVVRTRIWTVDADGNITGVYDSADADASGESTAEGKDEEEGADESASTGYWGPDSEGGPGSSLDPRIAAIVGSGGGGTVPIETAPIDPPDPILGEDQGGDLGPIVRGGGIDPIANWGPEGEAGSGSDASGGGPPPEPAPIDPPDPIPGEDQGGDLGPIVRGGGIDPIATPSADATPDDVTDLTSGMASAASYDPSIAGGDDADMDDLDIQRLKAPTAGSGDVLGMTDLEPAFSFDGTTTMGLADAGLDAPEAPAPVVTGSSVEVTEDEPSVGSPGPEPAEIEPAVALTEPQASALAQELERSAPIPEETVEPPEEGALDG